MMDTSDMNAKVWLALNTSWLVHCNLSRIDAACFRTIHFMQIPVMVLKRIPKSSRFSISNLQANTSSRSTGTMSRRSTGALTQILPVSVKHLESMWLLNEPKSSILSKISLLVPWHHHPTNIYHYIILPMGNSNWWPQLKVIACGECHSVAAAFDEVTKPGEHSGYVFVVVVFRPYPKKDGLPTINFQG